MNIEGVKGREGQMDQEVCILEGPFLVDNWHRKAESSGSRVPASVLS
jgi:hypothetical protein